MSARFGFRYLVIAVCLTIAVFGFPLSAEAASFVVNTIDDNDDGTCDSAHCSLREAINAANANAGPDAIKFDIPGNAPYRIALCAPLPFLIDDATIVDATTEPDYNGVPVVFIEPAFIPTGPPPLTFLAPCNPPSWGFWVQGNGITVRGFAIGNFQYPSTYPPAAMAIRIKGGTGNLIELNYVGFDPSGQSFGNDYGIVLEAAGQKIKDNVISDSNAAEIYATQGHHIIQGNLIGTDPTGTFAVGKAWFGIWLDPDADDNLIGGASPQEGNLISGNGAGLEVRTDHNRILGNLIGTDIHGTSSIPNDEGVSLNAGSYNLLGGPGIGEGNLISGNAYNGVGTKCSANGNEMYGNKIGTDISGTSPLGNEEGIILEGHGNTVGGATPGHSNLIAFNNEEGITMSWPGLDQKIFGNTITNNLRGITLRPAFGNWPHHITIRENSFSQNIELGIDLDPLGVTPNDPGDADVGPNFLLNFPVLNNVTTTLAEGTACPGCIVEIFIADGDPSGHGEGETFIGSDVADTTGTFSIPLSGVATCAPITATATDIDGNTSEFSSNELADCQSISYPLLGGITIGLALIGSIGLSLAGRRFPLSPGRLAALGAAGGGAVGVGLIIFAIASPKIQILMPAKAVDGPASMLPCERFLVNEELYPAEDAILKIDEDPALQWMPGENLPSGPIRWRVDLHGPGEIKLTQNTSEVNLPLSDFGEIANLVGLIRWRLTGEQAAATGDDWQPFCNPTRWYSFLIEPPPPPDTLPPIPEEPPEPTSSPTPTVTPTTTPTPCLPTATALENATCRFGPDKVYQELGYLLKGESALVEGRNADSTWWWIVNPDAAGHCWVWDDLVEIVCDTDALRVLIAPPTPTPTDLPVLGCMVRPITGGAPICVSPCPEGADPGDPCTP